MTYPAWLLKGVQQLVEKNLVKCHPYVSSIPLF